MAELEFFMTHNDTCEFVRFLIERFDARFVMDNSPTREPPVYDNADEIDRLVRESEYTPRFHILSNQWEKYPLSIGEVNAKDGRHFFYIEQRYGGPAFDYNVCRVVIKDGENFIIPGWFSDYHYYYISPSDPTTFDRPEGMSSAFKEVRRYMRRNGTRSVCQELGKPGPWILSDALRSHEAGTWLRRGKWHFLPKKAK